jgi:hypothetical protein
MSILDCLAFIAEPKVENRLHNVITDGVFECAIYRLGLDPKDWMDEPVDEREFILNYLEDEYGTNK